MVNNKMNKIIDYLSTRSDNSQEWEWTKDEWYLSEIVTLEEQGDEFCVCGTPIKDVYVMVNKITFATARVGKECYKSILNRR
jgi:hypothetical protein